MTTEEFQIELQNHDWHYEMSDDPKYYHAGKYNEHRLKSIADKNPELKAMFDAIYQRVQKAHRGR